MHACMDTQIKLVNYYWIINLEYSSVILVVFFKFGTKRSILELFEILYIHINSFS